MPDKASISSFVIGLLLFLPGLAMGATTLTNATCLNTGTSEINITIATSTNTGQNVTTISHNDFCTQGCNYFTGMCYDASQQSNTSIIIIIGIALISFVFAYIGTRVDKSHPVLQTLFVFLSIISLVASAGMLREFGTIGDLNPRVTGSLDNFAILVTYGFFGAIAYYIVSYVYSVFQSWMESTRRRKKMALQGRM